MLKTRCISLRRSLCSRWSVSCILQQSGTLGDTVFHNASCSVEVPCIFVFVHVFGMFKNIVLTVRSRTTVMKHLYI